MKFTITYTLEDYKEANKLFLQASKRGWPIKYLIPGIGILLLLIFLWMRLQGFSMSTWDWYALIMGIFFIIYPFLFIQFSVKRMFNKTKFLREPTEIEINDQGFSSKSSLVSGTMKWESYLRYAVNDRILIILQSPRTMTYIPRHIMNDQEWNELLNLVKSKLPSK
jgi:hypothetical protein